MEITRAIRSDLNWWIKNIPFTENPIRDFSYKIEIFSDASTTGWGIVCNGQKSHGFWSESESKEHINLLELKAAFFGIKCFASNLRDEQILLRIDNTTAIAYINRLGGIQIEKLSEMAREIWRWCEERNLWISASYINTKLNVEADAESRQLKPETEFELSPEIYNKIVIRFGKPEIDLFATRVNNKCRKYVSWRRDPGAWAVDAFTIDWSGMFFYAFPPFAIISKILQKIKREKAEGILVVPRWPAQPWFPLFMNMLTSKPLFFDPNQDLILSFDRKPHPLWERLTLVVGVCSGRR